MVVFGGYYGIGKDIVSICSKANARVYSFSRTENKTDISNVKNVQHVMNSVFDLEEKSERVHL